jgi:hypothetical protein
MLVFFKKSTQQHVVDPFGASEKRNPDQRRCLYSNSSGFAGG